jgi:hypothetical protein
MKLTPVALRKLALHRVDLIAARLTAIVEHHANKLLAKMPDSTDPNELRAYRQTIPAALAKLRKALINATKKAFEVHAKLGWKEARKLFIAKAKRTKRAAESLLFFENDTRRVQVVDKVLPAPNLAILRRMVGFSPISITKVTSPEHITSIITQAIADGWDRLKIGKELMRRFDVIKSTSQRIARTEGLRVATESQLAVSEQLDGMIVGYKIQAVDNGHSPTSRIDHKKRHGTIYYRNPEPGQPSMAEMPRPPLDPDGTIAYNCRCFLIPVFR